MDIPGSRIRATHQSTVISIVGEKLNIPVVSGGTGFFMVGDFRWRKVLCEMVMYSRVPPIDVIKKWCADRMIEKPYINIAECPDIIPPFVMSAQIGGTVHESLHRLRTSQGLIYYQLVHDTLSDHWHNISWSHYKKLLLDCHNVVEDVLIERLGNIEFPGVYQRLCDLSDLIIGQEQKSTINNKSGFNTADVIIGAFRDLGLGYDTNKNREAIEYYKSHDLKAYDVVNSGVLRPMLDKCIEISSDLKTGVGMVRSGVSVGIAMDMVAAIHDMVKAEKPQKADKSQTKPYRDDINEGIKFLLNNSKALSQSISQIISDSLKRSPSKAIYMPRSTSGDKIEYVKSKKVLSDSVVSSSKEATQYLRSRLTVIFRSMEEVGHYHGVLRGSALSDRMMVDTVACIRSGFQPNRAFIETTEIMDSSVAASIVIDESSSMGDKLDQTAGMVYALLMSLDSIGAASVVSGFSDGPVIFSATPDSHRNNSVHHRIFKSWEESTGSIVNRLSSIKSDGSTPMADGIQFSFNQIVKRNEKNKIIFVITDGQPNNGTDNVVKDQIRKASSLGIHTVGIGLGSNSKRVVGLFENGVWSDHIGSIAPMIILKLESIIRGGWNFSDGF